MMKEKWGDICLKRAVIAGGRTHKCFGRVEAVFVFHNEKDVCPLPIAEVK
jgi:hypothetical protein